MSQSNQFKLDEHAIALRQKGETKVRDTLGFIIFHTLPLGIFWTGASTFDWVMCILMYFVRMFFITSGYHRYFSHRTFKTSRFFQFILAFMAQTSVQKGILWWASLHRDHHRHSDKPEDPHSMKLYGFWYSHIGWIMERTFKKTNYTRISDFAKFAELRWLNKYYLVPPLVLAISLMLLGGYVNGRGATDGFAATGNISALFSYGWSTLLTAFFLSTAILYHGTFSINSLMHKFGKQRYETGDESRNSLILALLTLGEGWHNNHHYYMSSTRQGFFWWEIDITYYILKTLAFLRIVWDINEVPAHVKFSKSIAEAKEKEKWLREQKKND
jgi:stearoyl-CoA desaturase (delta-9 desaturase)